MARSEKKERTAATNAGVTPETYLLMNEREKDIEIDRAVARLQRRIQEILYLLEPASKPAAGK